MRLNAFLSLLLLLCLPAVPSCAAIPLITDDTGTQGKGKFQLEISPGPKFGMNSAEADYSVLSGISSRV
jgi:hypothetical protein